MALGTNTPKLIQKTVSTTNKKNNVSSTRNKNNVSNTNNGSKIGRPSQDPSKDTYNTKKMTFYVDLNVLQKLYNYAHWDRKNITEAFNIALKDGLKGKSTRPIA